MSAQKIQKRLFSGPHYLEQKKWTNLNDPNSMDERLYILWNKLNKTNMNDSIKFPK